MATRRPPFSGCAKPCGAIPPITRLTSCSASRLMPSAAPPRPPAKRISQDSFRRRMTTGRPRPLRSVPRGLERVRMDLGLPDALRVENVIGAAGQRDQRQLASFHLDAARRAYETEHDAEAISELQRAVYLSPYDHEAHLLLGRIYLRGGRLPDAIDALKISIWSSDTVAARLDACRRLREERPARTKQRPSCEPCSRETPANGEAKQRLDRLAGSVGEIPRHKFRSRSDRRVVRIRAFIDVRSRRTRNSTER